MSTEIADTRDYNGLYESIGLASNIIKKDYLYELGEFEIAEVPTELRLLDVAEYTRMFRFTKLVSDKDESLLDKLVTVLNAAHSSFSTVVTLIRGRELQTDYYMGIVSKDVKQYDHDVNTQAETFKGALLGSFPGLLIDTVRNSELNELCDEIFSENYVTSISGIASIRNDEEHSMDKYVQGIEHLVDAMQGREYSIIIIADPVGQDELLDVRMGYENLYTQLSSFQNTTLSYNDTSSVTLTSSQTEGVTDTVGHSTSLTQSISKTNGWSKTDTESHSTSDTTSKSRTSSLGKAIVGIASSVVAGVATVATAGAAAPLAIGAIGSLAQAGIGTTTKGKSHTESHSSSHSESTSHSETEQTGTTDTSSTSQSIQKSISQSEATGLSKGTTLQFSSENKMITQLLEKIDNNLERLDQCDAYGAFSCAAYVIASDPETDEIVANSYSALTKGDESFYQGSYINSWVGGEAEKIKNSLRRFSHPLFLERLGDNTEQELLVSPAIISNSYEVAVNLAVPKKSISGLSVVEMAAFGRNPRALEKGREYIDIGNVFHMGRDEKKGKNYVPVKLDLDSLNMHTFVTGSTGSGKSNAIYSLLERVMENNRRRKIEDRVSFMVIEPAKGEYKDKFGHLSDVRVLGTNAKKMELLRINPFSFPNDIHVLEHIDRLIEIFNVCWPMYAAMPAILKDAVERSYRIAGWDLRNSECRYKERIGRNIYPGFTDVLRQIEIVMNESMYSAESKGDYSGALCTRVKSLTNGIYGDIFCSNEIESSELFDKNVIVDLSRVGSVETKSLLMGLLVLKLQEYRMSYRKMNNLGLRHLTVLEEAHNLLKSTSTEQSADSSNLLGKSVEMLTNAIAEMRTYGEGFIIADQAPGLLDKAVIRNTNTKIILRLPDMSDRELVGKASSLNDDQILELPRLQTGVASVYQNDWLEPVLCHIHRCKDDETVFVEEAPQTSGGEAEINEVIKYIMCPLNERNSDSIDLKKLETTVLNMNVSTDLKLEFLNFGSNMGKDSRQAFRKRFAYEVYNSDELVRKINVEKSDSQSCYSELIDGIHPTLDDFSDAEQIRIIMSVLQGYKEYNASVDVEPLVKCVASII